MGGNSETFENINGQEAIKKIIDLGNSKRTCIMVTSLNERPLPARPMTILKIDDQGQFYFLSHRESEKNFHLESDNEMQVFIDNQASSEYLSLYGKAEVYRDQKTIDELYSAFANNWFDGKEDPDITVIRFSPEKGHYWDTKHGKMYQMAGMLVGAITGKQGDDGIEGDLKV